MSQSMIALAILGVTLLLYLTELFPTSITTLLAMIAMAGFGIISCQDAFSGFASPAVMLVAGMMIIGRAFFTTGLAHRIGSLLYRFVGTSERAMIVMILLLAALMSIFLNGSLTVAILMTVIDSIVIRSQGSITRKQTYFPLGVAATLGNNLTTISATSMITANALLVQAGYPELGLFAPTLVNLPAFLVILVLYGLFGYRLQKRWFDFPEVPVENPTETSIQEMPVWKMALPVAVLLLVVGAILLGADYGLASLLGAALLILTGCISEKEAFSSVSWPTVVLVGGVIGFSKGIADSGAGALIAEFILGRFGVLARSPMGLCFLLFLIGTLISNLMSDNAAVAILVPITLVLARDLGSDPTPLVISAASGIKVAVATPVSVATMTQIGVAGYRFRDYLRAGGLVNMIALAVSCTAVWLIYYA